MKPAASLHHFLGLASFEMLAMFRRALFYAFLSIYLRHNLGLSVTETTLFATLPMILNVLAQTFIWGRVSDRYQLRRTLIVIGELLAAVGTLFVWYLHRLLPDPAASGYVIILGLTAIELFWSMSNISWSALVSDSYTEQERSRAQGRLTSMGGLGRMAGVLVGGLLYDGLGFRYAGWGFYEGPLFFVASAVMVVSAVPLLFLPEGGIGQKAPLSEKVPPEEKAHPTLALYMIFLAGMVFVNFGRNSSAIIFTQYLTLETGLALDSRSLSYVVNTMALAVVITGWAAGWICRRIGNGAALLSGTAAAMIALSLVASSTDLGLIYASFFLRGVGEAVIMAAAYTIASILIPPLMRARLFAWFNGTFFLSFGLGATLIAGPIVDGLIGAGYPQTWAYQVSFASAAALTAVGFLIQAALFYRVRRDNTRSY
jgi:MFS family permease